MFKQESRYVTRGVNSEIDIRLQLAMWSLIDILKMQEGVEVDYLQVFKLKKEDDFIKIEHSQEVPEYKSVHRIEIDDIELDEDTKIFVIDSGDYSTMLLTEEY